MTAGTFGVRSRIALAMALVAAAAVGLATLLVSRGAEDRLRDAARARLASSAFHTAEIAAESYRTEIGWTPEAVSELTHVARVNGFRLALLDASGSRLAGSAAIDRSTPGVERAPVESGGRTRGAVLVAPGGELLDADDRELQSDLDELHLIAAVLALAAALAAAVLVAAPLARPLRRLTDTARRIEDGRLDARAPTTGGGAEIEELAHAINRLAESLEQEEATRRATVADVAHELRTPVTGIVSRVEAAQDGVLADPDANLAALHEETLRLSRLIDDLGQLAEAQRPGLTLGREQLDLASIATMRADEFEARFEANGVALVRDLSVTPVEGDRDRLEQVVDNLLSNALRYTDSGGRVVLRTTPQEGSSVIEVEDNGIGIPAEDLPHLFERFWRGEKSRSRATGGAGVGLAIVDELVRAHDGHVEVDSTPGAGSRFRIYLPRRDE